MTEKKREKRVFGGADYAGLFHFMASADYKTTKEYRTGNKRVYIKNYKVYVDNVLYAVVDKQKETVIHKHWKYFYSTISPGWRLRNAFNHYKCLALPALTVNGIKRYIKEEIDAARLTLRKSDYYSWSVRGDVVNDITEYQTYAGVDFGEDLKTLKELIEQHKSLAAEIDKARKEKEEKHRQEFDQRMSNAWQVIKKKLIDPALAAHPEATTMLDKYKIISNLLFEEHMIVPDVCKTAEIRTHFFNYSYRNGGGYRLCLHNSEVAGYIGVPEVTSEYGSKRRADVVWYNVGEDYFETSQGVKVEVRGLANKILDQVIAAYDNDDKDLMESFMHMSVGPYSIRKFNWDEATIQVGCHVFSMMNLKALQNDYYGRGKERVENMTAVYTTKITEAQAEIVKLQQEINKWTAKIKLLTSQQNCDTVK